MADLSTTILLVDDHPLFYEGLLSVLQAHRPSYRLIWAADAASGLEAVRSREIELALIDIMLPDMDGFAALARYQEIAPAVPRVLISGRDDLQTRLRAGRSGASGFISKSWPAGALVAAIDSVLDGECVFGEAGELDGDIAASVDPATTAPLTLRQREVLSLLAEGKCNKEIGQELAIADRTVRAHLTEIFQALGVRSRVQAILEAQRLGLAQ